MATIFRFVSLLLRRRQSEKAVKGILETFQLWKEEQGALPAPAVAGKKLLIVRLDDIGDYLLFRNSFEVYKNSARWNGHDGHNGHNGHEIVLLGNSAWAGLFDAVDSGKADRVIWVDKPAYLNDRAYRLALWLRLRLEGFETVICPSRTRPLLVDDLCVMATGAGRRIAAANSFIHPEWNRISDGFYTELFRGGDPLMHEFFFNVGFAEWCCGLRYSGKRPEITAAFERSGGVAARAPYILFFIGSSTKSKQWPVKRWIELAGLLGKRYSYKIIIAGGRQEEKMAGGIVKATLTGSGAGGGIGNIVGKATLAGMIDWVAGAAAVITNDTMAAHLGPSCNRPTLIIANGTNSLRFTDYAAAGMGNVVTVYPRVFLRAREKKAEGSFHHTAVSADIASIKAEEVVTKLGELIQANGSRRVDRIGEGSG